MNSYDDAAEGSDGTTSPPQRPCKPEPVDARWNLVREMKTGNRHHLSVRNSGATERRWPPRLRWTLVPVVWPLR